VCLRPVAWRSWRCWSRPAIFRAIANGGRIAIEVPGSALLCGTDDGKGSIVLDLNGGPVRFHALAAPSTVAQPAL
jgi:hypothetical protein